jgi:DNA ligase-1
VRLTDVVATSAAVARSSGRLQKIALLADLLTRTPPDAIETVVSLLSGAPQQGRIGIGGAALAAVRQAPPASDPSLTLRDVDAAFDAVRSTSGAGSGRARAEALGDLFRRATRDEQDFLARLLYGELRQGALEGVLVEAVARAATVPAASVRRAAMLAGALAPVARAAVVDGALALQALVVQPFRPVQPMLAGSAPDIGAAIGELGEASLEYKLDGARIQVHKSGGEVRVYSRTLRDVTAAVPEVVDAARRLPAREIVLDGEVLALRSDGTPHPFQVTMRRFGRTLDVDALRHTLPVRSFFFDCLYLDGDALIDEPLARRHDVLSRVAPPDLVVPRLVTAAPDAAAAFLEQALGIGHEGVMVKSLDGVYAAGRRGQAWLKVKQARTLDLVVLAVEWGSGRRRGTLSNLHLGARDAARGGFVMLGKTFKGLTDELLAWQTRALLALEVAREGHIVHVRPELVVEIAFNDIQASPHYSGGLALRFARVKRYRPDKTAAEADTFLAVQTLYTQMTGLEPPGPGR